MPPSHPFLRLIAPFLLAALTGCAVSQPPRAVRAQDPQRLTRCASVPACVSSQADLGTFHHVEPFTYTGGEDRALRALLQALRDDGEGAVIDSSRQAVHVTYRTPTGLIDDLTFVFQPAQGVIDVKSASRLGVADFGANRRRVERLRERFDALMR